MSVDLKQIFRAKLDLRGRHRKKEEYSYDKKIPRPKRSIRTSKPENCLILRRSKRVSEYGSPIYGCSRYCSVYEKCMEFVKSDYDLSVVKDKSY
jgi:hypothetical protein